MHKMMICHQMNASISVAGDGWVSKQLIVFLIHFRNWFPNIFPNDLLAQWPMKLKQQKIKNKIDEEPNQIESNTSPELQFQTGILNLCEFRNKLKWNDIVWL